MLNSLTVELLFVFCELDPSWMQNSSPKKTLSTYSSLTVVMAKSLQIFFSIIRAVCFPLRTSHC